MSGSNRRREAVFRPGNNCAYPYLFILCRVDNRRHGQQRFGGPEVIRGTDNHRAAVRHRAPFQGFRIENIRRPADNPEVFRRFDILADILLHLLLFHIIHDHDTVRTPCGCQDELLQKRILTGVKSQHHHMAFLNNL